MINIQNLSFHYKPKKPIYSGLNLELHAGNIYGLLGENGVGKTTLLKLISGLLFPNEGSVSTFGFEAKENHPDMLEKMYFLPEIYILPKLKVSEYINLYAPFYPKFDHQKMAEYLTVFGLSDTENVRSLSHGQQKKLLIGFGLATNTELLLMDEPTNGLDIPSKKLFRQLMVEAMGDQKTVIISTHQVRDLENLIDPIIILSEDIGRAPSLLLNNSTEEITQKLKFVLEQHPSSDALYSEPTIGGFLCVEPNTDDTESMVNVELLFNAAINNKDLFKKLFIEKSE